MDFKDTHNFKIGLNMDDTPADMIPGEYPDLLNIRALSSDEQHGSGNAETMQGEIEIPINVTGVVTYYGDAIGGGFLYEGYEEVQIGTQVWMKKNWAAIYPGGKVYDDNEANRAIYGGLYTHGQAMAVDFCPPGWRVPTEADIDILFNYLGGQMIAGGKLKEAGTLRWATPNTGASDDYGFRALPGGKFDLLFELLGNTGLFWLQDDGLETPVALPATAITSVSFFANWETVANADGYYLDVAIDPDFVSILAAYNGLDVGNVITYPVTGLNPETNYYYRLRAYEDAGVSLYSNVITLLTLVAVTASDYGPLYNWWAVTDARNICSAGWHIPTNVEQGALMHYIDPTGVYNNNTAGGHLKEVGLDKWNAPNAGAADTYGFSMRGSGLRTVFGAFASLKITGWLWSATATSAANAAASICYASFITFYTNYGPHNTDQPKIQGLSVRPIKDATTLTHGQTGTYTGNDGRVYPTICIGTQEWLAVNLEETLYRNGDPISVITDNAAWIALVTGAMCWYNNNPPVPIPEQYVYMDDGTTYIRKGVRDGWFRIDIALTALAFAGVENTDWKNIKSINMT